MIPKKQKYAVDQENLNDDEPIAKKSYTLKEKRKEYGNAYVPWDDEADELLCRMFDEGKTIALLSELFDRTKNAIRSRLKKLGKIE